MPKLIMFIGIPGSGKTTAAKKFQAAWPTSIAIYEADMFFEKDGKYKWNPNLLGQAHKWCFNNVEDELKNGNSVIVSNTFLTPRERKPYFELAKKYNAEVMVFTCSGEYQNVHNVPSETIERMKQKYVPYSENEMKNI